MIFKNLQQIEKSGFAEFKYHIADRIILTKYKRDELVVKYTIPEYKYFKGEIVIRRFSNEQRKALEKFEVGPVD